MVLQYIDGSPCPKSSHHKRSSTRLDGTVDDEPLARRKLKDHKDDKGDHGKDKTEPERRKSTLISLLCERDALAPKATLAFVGASPDECAYFFELRSPHACGGVSESKQALGPGSVFGIM